MTLKTPRTRWLVPLFLLLLLPLFTKTQCVYACSCFYDDTLTPAERALGNSNTSAIVFVGEAISASSSGDSNLFTFAVDTVHKGELAAEFTVTTYQDGAGCGDNFTIGATYLIFAGADGNTSLCSGNVQSPTADILTALGSGNPPSPEGSTGATTNPLANFTPAIFVLVGVLLFLLVSFVVRRMSRD